LAISKGFPMARMVVSVAWLAIVGSVALGQPIASPSPIAGRSGLPLSETFTPSSIFPSSPTPKPKVIVVAEGPPEPESKPEWSLLPPRLPKPWSGGADLGINGASGNSEVFNFRGSWNVRRKTESNVLTSDFLYVYSVQNSTTNTQQALFNTRDEILFASSKWSLFAANQIEYDELRAFRFRVGIYGGVGYTVLDNSRTTLRTRVGVGAVRELGSDGAESRWISEAIFGYDFRQKVTEYSSVITILDLYPRIDNFGEYRIRARLAYEWVIDPDTGTVLRFGIQDRFDSDPGNAKRNDLTYFTTLGLKF